MSHKLLRVMRSKIIRHMPRSELGLNILQYGRLRDWIKHHPCDKSVVDKFTLYDHVAREAFVDRPIDYLEFGVFNGTTMGYWSNHNKHQQSRFFGFDTFTGLPEEWRRLTGVTPKGTFSVNGEPPNLKDPRVRFIKGLFQETADEFLCGFQPKHQVVLNLDCDLYSSTLFVLTRFHSILKSGAIIFFDEFSSSNHEFRAFTDYVEAYRIRYELLGYSGIDYEHIAIRIL